MSVNTRLGPEVLALDAEAETARICAWMVETVASTLHRRGES